MEQLKGKTAIITGGAQGLGKQIALVFAAAGMTVVIADVNEVTANETAQEIIQGGGHAMTYFIDVANGDELSRMAKSLKETFGSIDVLVNNAAIDITEPFERLSGSDLEKIIDVNLLGPVLLSRYVYPYMVEQKSGHIFNISSTAAKRAWPNALPYHTTKWGLVGFGRALFTEARKSNIKVTTIVAGGMKTPFLLSRFKDIDTSTLQDPQRVADTIHFILTQPDGTIIPEILILPLNETSWP